MTDREQNALSELAGAAETDDPQFVSKFRASQRHLGGTGVYTFAVILCVTLTVFLLFTEASSASILSAGAALFFANARAKVARYDFS